jgi:uncharacterized membrane protein
MSKPLLIASLASILILVAVDFVWLSNAVNFLYRPKLGGLLAEKPVIWAAAAFYLLYGVGMALLVLRPALAGGGVFTAAWTGALLGLVAYGTYDLTNQATLKGWAVAVTVIDMTWGAFVTAVACAAGVWVAGKVG